MPFWGVLHRIHDGAGFVRRVDVGQLHALRTAIQERRNNLGLLPTGRTIGAMPLRSAAAMQLSAVSTVIELCSLSSRIQSKPR
jgi:hypothetical protein